MGATSGDHQAVITPDECGWLWQIDLPQADEKIANIDGAPWIRNQIKLHGVVDHIRLDFYHLRQIVQKARRGVFEGGNRKRAHPGSRT